MSPIEALARVQANDILSDYAATESPVPDSNVALLPARTDMFQSKPVIEAMAVMEEDGLTTFDEVCELESVVLSALTRSLDIGDFKGAVDLRDSFSNFLINTSKDTRAQDIRPLLPLPSARRRLYKGIKHDSQLIYQKRTEINKNMGLVVLASIVPEVHKEGPMIKLMREGELENFAAIVSLGLHGILPRLFDTPDKAKALAQKGFKALVNQQLPTRKAIDYETVTDQERDNAKVAMNIVLRAKQLFDKQCRLLLLQPQPSRVVQAMNHYDSKTEYFELPKGHPYTTTLLKIRKHPWYNLTSTNGLYSYFNDPYVPFVSKKNERYI